VFKLFPIDGGVCAPQRFFADGLNCGLKPEAEDIGFFRSDTPCDVAAVFTANRFAAAPVKHAKAHIDKKSAFMLINSKNANAMTGTKGLEDITTLLSEIPYENPLMCSTGVIGEFLPLEKLSNGIKALDFNAKNSDGAAKAIMTTDRWKKEMALEVELEDGQTFRIGAMAKGAGMIAPNMATMLCFITTDAAVPKEALQCHLDEVVGCTFNAVSVDGDMSTNDSVFIYANGASGVYAEDAFKEALKVMMHRLALELVKDGEGAEKLVGFEVKGAISDAEAEQCAKALSNSLLVKTALFGEDPNWGRLAMAIGASGVECDETTLTIQIGSVVLYEKGDNKMSKEVEERAAKVMEKPEFRICCDLGLGAGHYTAYGCDLGHAYVKINADYRT